MKCVRSLYLDDQVHRYSNELAAKLVAEGTWAYCPKKLWKERTRQQKEAA